MARVVVRISGPNETVVRHVVPFFARDLARLAADAHGWIREEADLHIFPYVIVPALVRALCAFADHRFMRGQRGLGSTRVSRVGFGVAPKQSLLWVSQAAANGRGL